MPDLQKPQLQLFQPVVPPPGLIPCALNAALAMLLRELMLSVVEVADGEKADE
jgi:hypothetical protein